MTKATIVAEIRADRGDVARPFDGATLFALRSRAAGGECELSPADRAVRLIAAAATHDLVELEEQDLGAEDSGVAAGASPASRGAAEAAAATLVMRAIPAERRVLFQRVAQGQTPRLPDVPCAFHHLVFDAQTHADTLRPLHVQRALGRRDVVAYADGRIGMWTRVVAAHLGAPAVIGQLDGDVADNGVPNVQRFVDDYGFPDVRPVRELFGIAGDPIFGSLSPRLHNAAFRELERPALYVPFHVESFDDFWSGIVAGDATDAIGLPIRAICVVSPHKEIALRATELATPIVQRTRSSNFFVREGAAWTADTTDAAGILLALDDHGVDVATLKAAVVGCGGSGRAIAAALQQAGADVTLVNRGRDRGALATRLLALPYRPLTDFRASGYSLVVNATPLGGRGEAGPFAASDLGADAIVVDLVYGSLPTPLIAETRASGRRAIDGKDILMKQAMRQFLLMTGQEMPVAIPRRILGFDSHPKEQSCTVN